MKIIDNAGSLQWRMRQSSQITRASGKSVADSTLDNKLRELHRKTTTTSTPASEGFYAEGRSALARYAQGFADIRYDTRAYSSGIQNARMSDQQIADLIERMNLSPR